MTRDPYRLPAARLADAIDEATHALVRLDPDHLTFDDLEVVVGGQSVEASEVYRAAAAFQFDWYHPGDQPAA